MGKAVSARLHVMICIQAFGCAGSGTPKCPAGMHRVEARVPGGDAGRLLVAYRTTTTPWTVDDGQDDQLGLCVEDDYEIVTACVDSIVSGVSAQEVLGTVSELPDPDAYPAACYPLTTGQPPGTITLSGNLEHDGYVALGNEMVRVNNSGDYAYRLSVAPGKYDFLASNDYGDFNVPQGAGALVIRRDIDLRSDTQQTLISVSATGQPLHTTPLNVSGVASDETLLAEDYLQTASTGPYRVSSFPGAAVDAVPAGLLKSSDEQFVAVSATSTSSTLFRGYYGPFDPANPAIALPGRLDTVQLSAQASWTGSLPLPYSGVTLGVSSSTTDEQVQASAGWIERFGTTTLQFDTTATGFDPSWIPDPTKTYIADFLVWYNDDARGTSTTTGISTP